LVTWRKLHREGKLTKEKQISSDPVREKLLRLCNELEETKLEREIAYLKSFLMKKVVILIE